MMPRTDDHLSALLAECSDMIVSGSSLAACLERFPDQASELEPLLAAVVGIRELRSVPPRAADVAAASRTAFMNEVFRMQKRRAAVISPQAPWWQRLLTAPRLGAPAARPTALFAILLIVIISGIVISGSVTLAASAVPGDLLYGVKTTSENMRVFFTLDSESRDELRAAYGQRRIDEAKTIVDRRRSIDNLRLQGIIESFDATQWVVSGLQVTLDASSQVQGEPAVGALVKGRMRAPGDGTLLLLDAEVQLPLDLKLQRAGSTATTAPTATPTFTSSPTAILTPTFTDAPKPVSLPVIIPFEPKETRTPVPTLSPSPTRMPMRTRAAVRIATATQTAPPASPTPPTRPEVKSSVFGRLTVINDKVWTINGIDIKVNEATEITGKPELGAALDCVVVQQPYEMPLALSCVVTAPPEAPPEPFEFQDYVSTIEGGWWTIGAFSVKVTGDTQLHDNPTVGDLANVKALHLSNGELLATSITAVRALPVLVEGIIVAYEGGTITLERITGDRYVIAITNDTQFVGTPQVGLTASVQALQMPDGSLIAQIVVVTQPAPIHSTAPSASP